MSSEQLASTYFQTVRTSEVDVIVEGEEEHRKRIREGVINIVPSEDRYLLLLNSGFDVARQVGMLYEMSEQNSDFQSVKSTWLEKTREDIYHFLWEFLARKPVLPINIAVEGDEIICPRYGNQKLIDATDETWRGGATKKAIRELSSRLISSPSNTLHVMTSPMGWVGKGLEVTESQTYIYRKNEDSTISGLTIRTSMVLSGHEELLKRLGSSIDTSEDQISRITDVSRTIATKNDIGFMDVAKMIKEIMGTEIAWVDESTGREVPFSEIFENLYEIPEVDRAIEALVDGFINFTNLSFNELSRESLVQLAVELGKIVIRIQKAVEITDKEESLKPNYEAVIYITNSMPPDEYRREAEIIEQRKGCTPSNSSKLINPIFGPMNILKGMNVCQHCGTTEGVTCGWCTTCWLLYGQHG